MTDLQEEITKVETMSSRAYAWVKAGHLRTVIYVIVAVLLFMGWNILRDTQKELALQKAKIGTLDNDFKALGQAFVGQGEIFKNNNAALAAALEAQGKQLTDAMIANGNQVRATFTSQGQILAELVAGRTKGPTDYTPEGGFRNAKLEQQRSGERPALAEVSVNYDPKNPDPTARITSNWQNYTEVFKPTVVEWQKKSDNSLSGTFRLTRTVYRADKSLVGTEDIPLTNATSSFTDKAFAAPEPRRWSVMLGPVYNYKDRQWSPGGGFDYRFTKNTSAMVGTSKDNFFAWARYAFK